VSASTSQWLLYHGPTCPKLADVLNAMTTVVDLPALRQTVSAQQCLSSRGEQRMSLSGTGRRCRRAQLS